MSWSRRGPGRLSTLTGMLLRTPMSSRGAPESRSREVTERSARPQSKPVTLQTISLSYGLAAFPESPSGSELSLPFDREKRSLSWDTHFTACLPTKST
jgi:hypothetical protein